VKEKRVSTFGRKRTFFNVEKGPSMREKKSLYIRKHRAIEEQRKEPSLGQKRNLYKGEKDPLKGRKGPSTRDIREKKASNDRDKGPQ
jgi:hypothetical protein